MTAYLLRMPIGIAGAISRPQDVTIEPVLIKTANAFSHYGLAGKYDGDFFVPLSAGDNVEKIAGFYVRPFPTTATPDKIRQIKASNNMTADVLKRGYLMVNIQATAVNLVKGAAVHIRIANPTTDSPLGALLAAAIPDESVAMPNAYFTGAGDATGHTEIAYKI